MFVFWCIAIIALTKCVAEEVVMGKGKLNRCDSGELKCDGGPQAGWTFDDLWEYGIWLGQEEGREGLPYNSYADLPVDYSRCTIDRIELYELTEEVFQTHYVEMNRPFIINNGVAALRWPGHVDGTWRSFEALASAYGDVPIEYKGESTTFGNVLQLLIRARDEGAGIALASTATIVNGNLSYDSRIRSDYAPLPVPLDKGNIFRPLVKAMNSMGRWKDCFSHSYLVVGLAGGGTSFHKDGWNTEFWNAAVTGSKHWLLMPTNFASNPRNKKEGAAKRRSEMFFDWASATNHDFFNDIYPQLRGAPDECTQREGDILWSPGGWYHLTINTAPSVISSTENQINARTIEQVFDTICYRDFRPYEEQEYTSFEEAAHTASIGASVYMCIALSVVSPTLFQETACAEDDFLAHIDANIFPRLAKEEMDNTDYPHVIPGEMYNEDGTVRRNGLPALFASSLQGNRLPVHLMQSGASIEVQEQFIRETVRGMDNSHYYKLLLDLAHHRPTPEWRLLDSFETIF